MALVVEHNIRKQEILENALDVFISQGYDNVTFQKIADRCNITRTTLYIYFKNKREIFLWSIKQFLSKVEKQITTLLNIDYPNASAKLKDILEHIVDLCNKNERLFVILLPYLLKLKQIGKSPSESVARRVLKVRHFLSSIIIQGIKTGEFKQHLNIKVANDLFYSLLESSVFRMSVLGHDILDIKQSIFLAVDGIKA